MNSTPQALNAAPPGTPFACRTSGRPCRVGQHRQVWLQQMHKVLPAGRARDRHVLRTYVTTGGQNSLYTPRPAAAGCQQPLVDVVHTQYTRCCGACIVQQCTVQPDILPTHSQQREALLPSLPQHDGRERTDAHAQLARSHLEVLLRLRCCECTCEISPRSRAIP